MASDSRIQNSAVAATLSTGGAKRLSEYIVAEDRSINNCLNMDVAEVARTFGIHRVETLGEFRYDSY